MRMNLIEYQIKAERVLLTLIPNLILPKMSLVPCFLGVCCILGNVSTTNLSAVKEDFLYANTNHLHYVIAIQVTLSPVTA